MRRRRVLWIVAIGVIVVLVLGVLMKRSDGRRDLASCLSNVKQVHLALYMYETDHHSAFHYTDGPGVFYGGKASRTAPGSDRYVTPGSLDPLVASGYLKSIPTCPSAQRDTYTPGFVYRLGCPGQYTVSCSGNWHARAGIAPDFPRYTELGPMLDTTPKSTVSMGGLLAPGFALEGFKPGMTMDDVKQRLALTPAPRPENTYGSPDGSLFFRFESDGRLRTVWMSFLGNPAATLACPWGTLKSGDDLSRVRAVLGPPTEMCLEYGIEGKLIYLDASRCTRLTVQDLGGLTFELGRLASHEER